ncbi:MAG: gfo/Idh/MocA family oxidoreductase [Deltaproteobacteria bacterium]|nr:MAG: gfo/Idh/MocA family oxidoreductase [Deltaproteobacteria bacterium]
MSHLVGSAETMIHLALVGCGRWGRNIARSLEGVRGGRLVACCDSVIDRARAIAEARKISWTPHFEEIVEDPTIDAVVIATPPAVHPLQARAALLSEKHVLVEKPFALSTWEACRLHRLASSAGRIVMAGHLLRYHPAVGVLHDLLAAGEIGRIERIVSQRHGPPKSEHGIGVWWTLAPHDLSLLLSLFPALPEIVGGHARWGGIPLAGPHHLCACLRFPEGIEATVDVSWLSPRKRRAVRIIGTGGTIEFDDGSDRLSVTGGRRAPWIVEFPQAQPLRRELQHFIDAIVEGIPPRSDGREAVRVTRLLEGVARLTGALGPEERQGRREWVRSAESSGFAAGGR